ncbi:MAG TPA: oxygenase MpaB family protein [Streptosporangiaceae bacterium]|nr:oxygenase MpaB family protein [Streptosporangiaceae bacterium]
MTSPADRADHGLFGPGSVTWRVMGDPMMWVAGLRALYLQALHPTVMRGTWQNTSFADRTQAWGRFVRTTEFVRIRTYGSMAEVERAGRRLRKIHSSLTGVAEDGRVFRLDEPDLLLWVHCGEIASYADIARRCGARVTAAELDTFVDEQRRSAAVVGLDPAAVPASMAELDDYYAAIRPQLHVTAEARQALRRSFTPQIPLEFAALRLAVPPLNTLAFASLPRWARRMYGTPGSPLTDAAATLALRAAHESTARIPRQVIEVPVSVAVRARRRIGRREAAWH